MKLRNIKLNRGSKKIIPIFFATDDNYIPFLDVALRSLIKNASKKYKYEINILNTGIKAENISLIKLNENENFKILFRDITADVEPIKNKLKGLYHFSVAMYYRLFIENLFPQYDKVIYLDCDIVVLGDVSKLYNTYLGNNLVAGVTERIIYNHPVFSEYVRVAMNIEPINYINSGILVMNLKKFRECNIEEQFVYLLSMYNFDVVDPDQAYLNVLCRNKIKYLPNGWNKEPLDEPAEGGLNIVHYALYKKPWQYDDILNVEYFWQYAKESPFYQKILDIRESFDDVKKSQKEKANVDIVEHAQQIIKSDKTFSKVLFEQGKNVLENVVVDTSNVSYADA